MLEVWRVRFLLGVFVAGSFIELVMAHLPAPGAAGEALHNLGLLCRIAQ